MWGIVVMIAVACAPSGTKDPPVDEPERSGDTGEPPPEGCAPDPGQALLDVAMRPGPRTNQLEVTLELARPSPTALLCTASDDPLERHLVESEAIETSHTLRIDGLLPQTTYTCAVAPTCPVLVGPPTTLSFETGGWPGAIPRASVEVDPKLGFTGAWTLMNKPILNGETWLVVYDDAGIPRWWHEVAPNLFDVEVLYHPEDHSVVWGGGFSPEGRARVVHLWDGETYSADLPGWESTEYHHDAKRLADGRILTLEVQPNLFGVSYWDGFRIVLHDPDTQRIEFSTDSQRYVNEGLLRVAGGWLDADPYHANWLDWRQTPRGPELYVSLCFEHQLIAIDGDNGDVLWQLGAGRGWTVLDEAGDPLPESALPQCQHGVEVDGDRFLLYDNGQDRGYSQAVEWEIDGIDHTAQRSWAWSEPGWSEAFLGDVDYLKGGRVLITEARFGSLFGQSEIVEVDRDTGRVASRMSFSANEGAYRAERYGGCEMFRSARHCPELAQRIVELEPALRGG